MSDILLAVAVDTGAAAPDPIREKLIETVQSFATLNGLQAVVVEEDAWLEHELARALRGFVEWLGDEMLLPSDEVIVAGEAALRKYDAVYGSEADETPAQQP